MSIHNNASTANSATRVELGFVGAHSDIGGGYKEGDLSDVTLNWITQQASKVGATFNLIDEDKVVKTPIIHDSLDVFPFINADRDFLYMDGTERDQAGITALLDSTLGLFQKTWNNNNAYGLNAEQAVKLFDSSLKEFYLSCLSPLRNCDVYDKGEDKNNEKTLVGKIKDNNYQQILSQPPYNLSIVIDNIN